MVKVKEHCILALFFGLFCFLSFCYGEQIPQPSFVIEDEITQLRNELTRLKSVIEPIPPPSIYEWPGNGGCVSCNFFAGVAVAAMEIGILLLFVKGIFDYVGNPYKIEPTID